MKFILSRALQILALMLLCQCGAPQPPQCRFVPFHSRAPAAELLAQAHSQWDILANPARRSQWPAARESYNTATAKLFDQLRCFSGDWDSRSAALGTRLATPDAVNLAPSAVDTIFPASAVSVRIVKCHQTTPGVGLPVVGWRQTSPVGSPRQKFLLPNGLPYNLTVMLAFDRPGPPEWRFIRRWNSETTQVAAVTQPLAADWSAANAFYWKMCELDDLKLQNVILPDRFTEETGLYFVTPYDPEKIPLVFVHGLVSSPDAFKNLINELAPLPWFRQKYQIWLYNYPTGNPWLYSSMRFREIMRDTCAYARTKGHDRNLNRMVIVCHSMGGLVTRSSVTPPGQTLYDTYFNKPLDSLHASNSTRAFISDALLYKPLPEPKRVVFLAVPHRGSPLANRFFSNWISKLIRLPKTLTVELLDASLLTVNDMVRGSDPELPGKYHSATSIDTLSPSNPANLALNKLSLPKSITFNSIIGDRGKGNTPNSSDGVVPYWSSHVTPVQSEKIVPSTHGVPDNPDAAVELRRILLDHCHSR